MRYRALATDYDGTLAHDGRVDEPTIAALHRARRAGVLLVLVTGRELTELTATFAHLNLFDSVVVENGAVLYDPLRQAARLIAQAPPPGFVRMLQDQNIPLSVGHSIVATVEPHEHAMLDAIRKLGLEWHVIFNKGAVMALPSTVTKATGFACALKDLNLTAEETVGVGDAQNDQAFLRMCGLAVAVANALPSLKAQADLVTDGARGAGVIELIDRLLSGRLADVSPRPEHHEATPAARP